MTNHEIVLLAACDLERASDTFAAEFLVVRAWERDRESFGLNGFEDRHPDSNRVLTCLMGKRGLVARGWLRKTGSKQYAVTREGRMIAQSLTDGKPVLKFQKPAETVEITADQDEFLRRLFASQAWQKVMEGRAREISYVEACNFWGIAAESGAALGLAMRVFRGTLVRIDGLLVNGECVLSDGRSVSAEDTGRLENLSKELEQKFGKHLKVLMARGS